MTQLALVAPLAEIACTRCGVVKPRTEEYFRIYCKTGEADWQKKLKRICRECELGYIVKWRKENPDKIRKAMRERWRKKSALWRRDQTLSRYKLSEEKYQAILASQNGGCGICGRNENIPWKRTDSRYFAVDHSHDDGRIRGLLCDHCNRGLGMFLDSEELLMRAALYLERSKT